jgi:hypothetical protein
MISYALIVLVSVFASMSLASCGADESYTSDRIVQPAPKDTTTVTPPTPDPDPEPEKKDSTGFIWNTCVDQTVDFNSSTEEVTSINKWQVTNNGTPDFMDATLNYLYGVDFTAPSRIVTMSPDTTAYRGGGLFKSDYSNFRRVDKDSLWDVTSYIEGGYRTQYYTMSLKTHRIEGIDLRAGKRNPYLNVKEHPTFSSVWHEKIFEVEVGDSIFNRETVHNVLTIALISDKGQTWRIKREKIVVVDHFVKIREKEKEEEEIKADVWVTGLGRMVSLTRGIREDSRNPCDFALFEGSNGYTIIIDTYSTEGKYLSTEKEFHGFDECPKSNDYDGVAYIKGHFYPGAITYDYSSKGTHDWVVTCYINGNVEQQGIKGQDAVSRGIKNFKENNSAYPWPYLTNMSTSKEVNGKKVITVNGKTSEGRAVKQHIVADSLLKK